MNEERIIQAVGTMIGKLNQKITRLDKNVTKLDKKIDTVSQDLRSFKEETNTGINNLKEELNSFEEELNSFEEETRENFVSMSSMFRNTNERITELDKKIDKKFEENYRVVGDTLNSAFASIDRNYVKKSKVVS